MAAKKKRSVGAKVKSTAKKTAVKAAKRASSGKTISAWQDDPASGLPVISRPVPDLSKKPLAYKIKGTAYPAAIYETGTPQFRYWTAAEALRRGGDFWAPLLNVKQWEVGPVLPVGLDEGEDLNAYYNRSELAFFHQAVDGTTYFSGESPDVLCHEMGHACLDTHRPELWDTPFIEAGAFHESFGDQSAILSQLQLPSVRTAALAGLVKGKASQLSRCAEQLGAAIRKLSPDAVDSDCLRDAYNKFTYIDPQTLPDSAPATQLCAEVHSFSRVFTGAFYDILSGMLKTLATTPGDAELVKVAVDYARILLAATATAPIQPNYFAQVAAHMIDADTANGGKYGKVLTSVFVARKIIPEMAVQHLAAHTGNLPNKRDFARVAASIPPTKPLTQKVRLSAKEFGLSEQPLIVQAPVERKPFLMVAASLSSSQADSTLIEQATHRFVKMLFAHNRVDTSSRSKKIAIAATARTHVHLKKTHVLMETRDGLQLVRRLFHCGCRI